MNARDKQAEEKREARLRVMVLSAVLRAEVNGEPLEEAPYSAKYRKRAQAIRELAGRRLITYLPEGKLCVTFDGLLRVKGRVAGAVITDCRNVYNFLATEYRKDVKQQVTLAHLAERIGRDVSSVALAVWILKRDSGINIGGQGGPYTPESTVSGTQQLLDKSFTARVKARREELTRPTQHFVAPVSNKLPWHLDFALPGAFNTSYLEQLGSEEVRAAWTKCQERLSNDPDGALTAARSLVESACKQVLKARSLDYSDTSKLPELWARLRQELNWDPVATTNKTLRSVLQSAGAVVHGLNELRNVLSDSHGKEPGGPKASYRHALLAVTFAWAMAEFILSTADGQNPP